MSAASPSVCTNKFWSVDLEGFVLLVSSLSYGKHIIYSYFSTSGFLELWGGVFNGEISYGVGCCSFSLSVSLSLTLSVSVSLSFCLYLFSLSVCVCLSDILYLSPSACIMSDCLSLHFFPSDAWETGEDPWGHGLRWKVPEHNIYSINDFTVPFKMVKNVKCKDINNDAFGASNMCIFTFFKELDTEGLRSLIQLGKEMPMLPLPLARLDFYRQIDF